MKKNGIICYKWQSDDPICTQAIHYEGVTLEPVRLAKRSGQQYHDITRYGLGDFNGKTM